MSQFAWTFPGGRKTIQKPAAPVAGNIASTITVPSGKIWLLLNVSVIIVTDATVADRQISISTRDSTDVVKFMNMALKSAASETVYRYFSREISTRDTFLNSLGLQLLEATEDIYLFLNNGVAGDTYDYLVEYLEIDAP